MTRTRLRNFSDTSSSWLTRQKEGVMLVSGRMLLRLEQGVKVPEGAFYEVVGWHFSETTERREHKSCVSNQNARLSFLFLFRFFRSSSPHLQEDLPELCSHLHQRMQVATVRGHTHGIKVVGFKFLLFPAAPAAQQEALEDPALP